jgi:signal transduction histidine kinase
VTNVSQFKTLSGTDFLSGCDFHLSGVATLVDRSRNLVVLQDETGAVALHLKTVEAAFQFGHRVSVFGTNCTPLFPPLPEYPWFPSGWDIRDSFDAPASWSEFHLTRMRGWIRPPVTGEYRFWIASDNSSELWLSTNASPAHIRRLASVPRFGWVEPRQWDRYPSQHSEVISLKAGDAYYIEALFEQGGSVDHLEVGWQIPPAPTPTIDVIEGRFLTPWNSFPESTAVPKNGVLREFWTNYTTGDLSGLAEGHPYESALSVREAVATDHGAGSLPKPELITLNQRLPAGLVHRWVVIEGMAGFNASDGSGAILEICDDQARAQIRLLHTNSLSIPSGSNVVARVEGVCEPILDHGTIPMPGVIWVSDASSLSFHQRAPSDSPAPEKQASPRPPASFPPGIPGFFGTMGIPTFNDRVFDTDYIFLQMNSTVIQVLTTNAALKNRLKLERGCDLGGFANPNRIPMSITPIFVTDLGRRRMPVPITPSAGSWSAPNLKGRWCEFEGIGHKVNPDATVSLETSDGPICVWIGQTTSNQVSGYVDARIRVRGVLIPDHHGQPALLVPSTTYVQMLEASPGDPFGIPLQSAASIQRTPHLTGHRIRLIGQVTCRDDHSIFVQDETGGIRVQTTNMGMARIGARVDLVAFPARSSPLLLVDAVARPAPPADPVTPMDLNAAGSMSRNHSGILVTLAASLMFQIKNHQGIVFQLQEKDQVYVASLPAEAGAMAEIAPGSRLCITGVCSEEPANPPATGSATSQNPLSSPVKILMRSPHDVRVLRGPPWWTWKRTVTLLGSLFCVLVFSLTWVHMLHRRLERQKADQLAFSRHVLQKLEEERRRIAVNLHDSLGQTLLAIKNQAVLGTQRLPEAGGCRDDMAEISRTTALAIDEVRRITQGLRPPQLDRLGLTQAIQASINHASKNSSIEFASRVEEIDGLFDKDSEIHVYRIVQEALTNVVKHSAASEATVVVKKRAEASSITLSIRDNGRGFDPDASGNPPGELGYGLAGMKDRARILGGTLALESHPGTGTSLTVTIPIKRMNS